ncbi:hypothetical protein HEP87_58810 [Streptomyces sp. S1D4-11]|nr:hypothetical protein [Streptomyces sp. S1D4-11]
MSSTDDGLPAPEDGDADEQTDGYTIVRELGRGAQGIVCLARQQDSGESLALKVLRPEVAVRPDAVNGLAKVEFVHTRNTLLKKLQFRSREPTVRPDTHVSHTADLTQRQPVLPTGLTTTGTRHQHQHCHSLTPTQSMAPLTNIK